MEASVAAAGGQAGQGGEGGGAAPGTDGAPDMSTLQQTLASQQEGQQELRGIVEGIASQFAEFTAGQGAGAGGEGAGAEEAGAGDELDLGFLEDPTLDAQAMAGHLQGLIDQRAQQIAQSQIDPIAQRMDAAERRSELAALVEEVPELKDEKIAQQVVSTTATLADAYGWPEQVKTDPKMYRIVYLASKAMEIAGEEGNGADASVATLEGGGGARAAGLPQGDLGEAIVGARKGRSALPFG